MPSPEVTERPSHGAPTWLSACKSWLFVTLWADGHHDNQFPHRLRGATRTQQELTASDPERFFLRLPYVGGRGWIGVRLDGDADRARSPSLCQDAYRVIAPARLAADARRASPARLWRSLGGAAPGDRERQRPPGGRSYAIARRHERLGIVQPPRPPRPQADRWPRISAPRRARFDGGAPGDDTFGHPWFRVRIPGSLFVRAAEQDGVPVREHVHDPRRLGDPVDEELLDARVGGDDAMPAHPHDRRSGPGRRGGARAVDDDRSGAGQAGQRGYRETSAYRPSAGEPAAQVVQVNGHGRQWRGVGPAAEKPVGSRHSSGSPRRSVRSPAQ